MLAPLRFIWNATRGHRLAPWRSEYLKWRVETYSGKKAETLTTKRYFRVRVGFKVGTVQLPALDRPA